MWPDEPMPAGSDTLIEAGKKGSFDDPFRMFSLVHSITDNVWAVGEAMKDVIEEFADDGVIYLEIRTTPRRVAGRMEKEEYCRAVLDQIVKSRLTFPQIIVKLIIAVDRRLMQDFEEHIQLYNFLQKDYPGQVVGIDISGDPRQGNIIQIIPRMQELRNEGIRFSVHLAEVFNKQETLEFLEFGPDRIGHGTCIHPSLGGCSELWDKLESSSIPVEVCMTSNVICNSVPSYAQHHAGLLHNKVPFILCTDDKGVFSCSLSGEYRLAGEAFGWDSEKLFRVASKAVNYIFSGEEEKEMLKITFTEWRMKNADFFNSKP
ncbi:adenosine deaminase-like protein isoform X3 [Eurytemora carolleeae]|nr:adenosine deaminase-like protein isoform X3 [Eurytemora carolleeae]|eukprot:XP_023342034.1 adenosine deaminase-like protein isoform X3 [Eurytemora affinis]